MWVLGMSLLDIVHGQVTLYLWQIEENIIMNTKLIGTKLSMIFCKFIRLLPPMCIFQERRKCPSDDPIDKAVWVQYVIRMRPTNNTALHYILQY